MDAVYIVFMVLVCFFCVFCMGIALMDMVGEAMNRKKRRQIEAEALTQAAIATAKEEKVVAPAPVAAVVEEPAPVVVAEEPKVEAVAEPTPAEEEVVTEEVAEEEAVTEPTEEDDGAVSFKIGNVETLEDKYLALSAEEKGYYDAILFHAIGKEGAKRFRTTRYEEIKVGRTRLVRLSIKRGVVTCEFTLYNTNFKNYVDENKLSVKHAATVLKINDQAAVQAAIDSIDIVVQNIAEEKEYKKQLAREKRKQARMAKENAESAE